jgi:hypothetical protein
MSTRPATARTAEELSDDDAADSDTPLDQHASPRAPELPPFYDRDDPIVSGLGATIMLMHGSSYAKYDAETRELISCSAHKTAKPDDVGVGQVKRIDDARFVRIDETLAPADAQEGDVVCVGSRLYRRLHDAGDDKPLRDAAFLRGYELRPLHERVLGGRSPAGAWTPRWALEYQMPRAALTHHFDVQNLFAAQLDEQQAAAPRKKGGSLRRLRRARTATDARNVRLELSKQQIKTLNDETERIVRELSERVEIFSALLAEVAGLRDADQQTSVRTMAELFLVDYTVTQHPNLKALGMPDNRLLIEAARAAVFTFACGAAVEARYRLIDAERRRDAVLRSLGVWLDKTFGSEAANGAVPVAWNLSEDTHAPLPADTVVARHNNRLLRETPLLMLGVLLQLEWHDTASALLRRWWRDCL